MSEVGFVGLGNMGRPMAERMIGAGYKLVVNDRAQAAVAALTSAGAEEASSLDELATRVETIFLSLPTPDVVLAVGRSIAANPGVVKRVVDLSTTGPKAEMDLAEILSAASVSLIDSPVSGGVAGAKKGTLALMAAGPSVDFAIVEPMLLTLGKVIRVAEEPGKAQVMKLINNICSAAALAITSEAMVMGAKAGLDADVMIEVLNAGSGRTSASFDKIPRFVLPRGFDFGFAISLSLKDIRLCLEEAERLGVPMMVGNAVRMLFSITKAELGPDADMTAIIRPLEQWAETEVRGKAAGV
ncbi:NAD(P)-dependent oxidoreductase [Brucella thiophenivorans]|uniref:NADP oxidoreductase coenzyme F420-dependent family protein n=1 Tax=Brucella thiophenivorans TaxID=571255 RepID=A0A256FAP3_9HYPH|nr:NAD(P)-dependent oxidoreductase [Brucella thiophenivorans]OYR11511.1 NADP oxidoreductase coenzyme F420-dependent family protein [Brucella thiophenivorans]